MYFNIVVGVLFLVLGGLPALATEVVALKEEGRLLSASKEGDLKAVKSLIVGGADVSVSEGDGRTSLHIAAMRGDKALAEVLIAAGSDVEAGTRIGGYTPLHMAARNGRAEIVRLLLSAGAEVDRVTTNTGVTALHLAAASGSAETVEALLSAGSDVNAREASWMQTPLMFAASEGHADTVRVLLDAGADPSLSTEVMDAKKLADALGGRSSFSGYGGRIEKILERFKEMEGGNEEWSPTPRQVQAAIEVDREYIKKYMKGNAPEISEKKDGEITISIMTNEVAAKIDEEIKIRDGVILKVIVQDKVDNEDNKKGEGNGESGMLVVSDKSLVEILASDTNLDDKMPQRRKSYAELVGHRGGLTALLHAARGGHFAAAVDLIEGGADIDQASAGDNTTPLLMAALNGYHDLMVELLERGADPNITSDANVGPLYAILERRWAPRSPYSHPVNHRYQKIDHYEALAALLEAGADPNVRVNKELWYSEFEFRIIEQGNVFYTGSTPFWRAAQAIDVKAMRMLFEAGAKATIPNKIIPPRRRRSDKKGESLKFVLPEPVVGGPGYYPLHLVAGAGYGEHFISNAHVYAKGKWMEALKFMVEEVGVADINMRDGYGNTVLHHAAARGDYEMVQYLIDRGAAVEVVNWKGQTTADMANGPVQRVPPFPEVIAFLEEHGAANNDNCKSC